MPRDNAVPSTYAVGDGACGGTRRVKFTIGTSSPAASGMHPAEPDSREKPGEDPVCAYAHDIGEKCAECKPYAGDRTADMRKGTVPRIHKPGGEGK